MIFVKAFELIMCHLVGDYVLQSDFLAKTKGENYYHMLVHSFLYIVPFYIVFGMCWQLFILLGSHIIIDSLKAHFNKINYPTDQILHYILILTYFI